MPVSSLNVHKHTLTHAHCIQCMNIIRLALLYIFKRLVYTHNGKRKKKKNDEEDKKKKIQIQWPWYI